MVKEFKSFYKEVTGNEGDKCHYNVRLDTYGCGCQHDCSYCYAKSLLSFRGLWNTEEPAVADVAKIRRRISKLPKDKIIRLGGMTDCFMPQEEKHGVTRETIKALNENGIGYLIVTKSDKEISVCEDVTEHYVYWKNNVNFNKDDCCNLRCDGEKK